MTRGILDRERRLEAISLADEAVLTSIADELLESTEVQISRGPTVGLLMVRVEEPSVRLPFNFAEVTVSEAEVLAGGQRGYAMVMGRAPEKALAGAIIDGALEAGHPASGAIEQVLNSALARESARLAREWARVAPTTVKFEEMAP
jgi:alpha-D-ribose 1-methylphosphonate 5-triphosphate synthase subunit PhnG